MINKIAIIGGGTSGWWCAAYLQKMHPNIEISLYESPNIPVIGVGESTMPNVRSFFDELGIEEKEWMKSCNAVKKQGNIKSGFNFEGDDSFNFLFIHENFNEWFEKYKKNEVDKYSVYNLYNPDGWQTYAYHLDSSKAWQVVKKHTKNINNIFSEVNLENLPEADLYIDCTGFSRTLIRDKTLKKYPDTLVNTCIVRRIEENYKNYTESKACDYGWEFNVYLSDNRVGCGYVFDGSLISVEDAKKEYMKKNINRKFLSDFRVLKWDPGRLKTLWQGNIVAIGLSSGFIDPLEANSLSILVAQIRTLSRVLNKPNADRIYNKAINKIFDQVADYIWHHYACSNRNDTSFWQYYSKLDGKKTLFERIKSKTNLKQNLYPSYIYSYLAIYYNLI